MNIGRLIDRYFIKQPRLRRFVTNLLESDRDVRVELAGTSLLINSRREHGYLRASRFVKRNGTLRDEIPVLANLFSIIRDGDTFVDIGANVGLYTHSMSRLTRLYPNFQIISIEPHPETYKRLSALPVENVSFLNLAMSDKSGELVFTDGAVSHVFTTVDQATAYNIPNEQRKVNAKRLDDLEIDSNSIVLKIDTEGQEWNVLQGALNYLVSGKIKAVYLDGYGGDIRINDLLISHGFRLYEGRTLEPLEGTTFSLLALKPDKI